MSAEDRQKVTPRTVMLGGKAFATYTNAKRIVKLVNDVGAVVNKKNSRTRRRTAYHCIKKS
jgi:glycogen phosphorylase